jgi:hypothetical protein
MARIQILELPTEHHGDDMTTPFLLVVDQCEPQRIPLSEGVTWQDPWQAVADQAGARGVIVVPDTIEIPVSNVPPYLDDVEQSTPSRVDDRAIQAEAKLKAFAEARHAVEQERKATLTDALGMDRTRDWDDIVNAARGILRAREADQLAIQRVRNLPEQPEIMNAQQPNPNDYLHGYRVAILDAKRAAAESPATDGVS